MWQPRQRISMLVQSVVVHSPKFKHVPDGVLRGVCATTGTCTVVRPHRHRRSVPGTIMVGCWNSCPSNRPSRLHFVSATISGTNRGTNQQRRYSNNTKNTDPAADRVIALRLYRVLMRQVRALERQVRETSGSGSSFLLQSHLQGSKNYSVLHNGVPTAEWPHLFSFMELEKKLRDRSMQNFIEDFFVDSDDGEIESDDEDEDDDQDYDKDCNDRDWSWVNDVSPECRTHAATVAPFDTKAHTSPVLWCTIATLRCAIRTGFVHAVVVSNTNDPACQKSLRTKMQARCIDAYSLLDEQRKLSKHWSVSMHQPDQTNTVVGNTNKTNDKNDNRGTIRVTAISLCVKPITKIDPSANVQYYHYAYRILVENLQAPPPTASSTSTTDVAAMIVDGDKTALVHSASTTVQLVGRSWIIDAIWPPAQSLSTPWSVRVHAPTGGCVGQWPVLEPGTAFWYQSSATAGGTGRMSGCLHFITVPPGVPPGLRLPPIDNATPKFEVAVAPFPLSSKT